MSVLIKIKPFDTLYFRSGRPFTMGSETWADVVFPPAPSNFYGAIRTFLIFQRGDLKQFESKGYSDIGRVEKVNNEKVDKRGSLMIKGPFLFYDKNVLFPAPLDLVEGKEEKSKNKIEEKLVPLMLIDKPNVFISDDKLENYLVYKPKEKKKEPKGWLNKINFKDYLKNRKDKYNFKSLKKNEDIPPYLEEPKIGIKRERDTLTSEVGHIYRIPMIRLNEGTFFVLQIDGLSDAYKFPQSGVFKLGGEGKGVKYEVMEEDIFDDIKNLDFNFENDIFKLYLATPAIFKKGWLPFWINENDYTGEYDGIKLELIACAIGKPVYIGGWDMANKRPKPTKKAVPAGSVYYFKILRGSKEDVKEKFHFKNISDFKSEEGFGLSILGEVKK